MLQSSWISRKSAALIVRYSQKKECISIIFYSSEKVQLLITLEPLDRFKWGFQQNVPSEDFDQVENWKCHMCYFWLIPLDRITFVVCVNDVKLTAVMMLCFVSFQWLSSWLFTSHSCLDQSSITCFCWRKKVHQWALGLSKTRFTCLDHNSELCQVSKSQIIFKSDQCVDTQRTFYTVVRHGSNI